MADTFSPEKEVQRSRQFKAGQAAQRPLVKALGSAFRLDEDFAPQAKDEVLAELRADVAAMGRLKTLEPEDAEKELSDRIAKRAAELKEKHDSFAQQAKAEVVGAAKGGPLKDTIGRLMATGNRAGAEALLQTKIKERTEQLRQEAGVNRKALVAGVKEGMLSGPAMMTTPEQQAAIAAGKPWTKTPEQAWRTVAKSSVTPENLTFIMSRGSANLPEEASRANKQIALMVEQMQAEPTFGAPSKAGMVGHILSAGTRYGQAPLVGLQREFKNEAPEENGGIPVGHLNPLGEEAYPQNSEIQEVANVNVLSAVGKFLADPKRAGKVVVDELRRTWNVYDDTKVAGMVAGILDQNIKRATAEVTKGITPEELELLKQSGTDEQGNPSDLNRLIAERAQQLTNTDMLGRADPMVAQLVADMVVDVYNVANPMGLVIKPAAKVLGAAGKVASKIPAVGDVLEAGKDIAAGTRNLVKYRGELDEILKAKHLTPKQAQSAIDEIKLAESEAGGHRQLLEKLLGKVERMPKVGEESAELLALQQQGKAQIIRPTIKEQKYARAARELPVEAQELRKQALGAQQRVNPVFCQKDESIRRAHDRAIGNCPNTRNNLARVVKCQPQVIDSAIFQLPDTVLLEHNN